MNCKMVNDNLAVFLRNWDTILSGIPVQPDNSVFEPLFHRQVKKCKDIAHDISVYDRALEGHRTEILPVSVQRGQQLSGAGTPPKEPRSDCSPGRRCHPDHSRHPTRQKQKRVPKGFCIDFVRNGSCNKDKCTYKREMPRGRSSHSWRRPRTL